MNINEKVKIVCVDDEELTLEHLKDVLSENGHNVVCFTDPNKAYEYIVENSKLIAIVVSDYSMPDMDGFKFREKMIPDLQAIPFILVTSFYTKEMAFQGMNYQISSFVDKSNEEEIVSSVKKYSEARINAIKDDLEMISGFLDETSPMIEDIESCILQLEDNVNDTESLDIYFRLLHTIKGTSACLGLTNISEFSHKYEDFVSLLKNKQLVANAGVITILLKGLDVLKMMLEDIENDVVKDYQIDKLIEMFNIENLATTQDDAKDEEETATPGVTKSDGKKTDFVKVSMDLLDEFMELNGELTVIRNTISNSVKSIEKKIFGDRDVEILTESIGEMHKTCSNLQNQISEFRKVNLSTIFRPLKRVVRDAATALGKDVEYITHGEELRVDNIIGKILSGSLIHLVRNSIDHGLETPADRQQIGKVPKGTIQITAEEIGENFRITIEDDGKGINPEVIRNKAIEKGLYTEEQLNKMSENKILQIVFEPGFSTAQQVSDLSGRGVGMDMVKSSVTNAKGKIHIESKVGVGTKFVLDIPIPKSVLIVSSLLVKCASQTFVFSIDDIFEVERIEDDEKKDRIKTINGAEFIEVGDKHIPLIHLSKVLNIHSEKRQANGLFTDEAINIVILRVDSFKFGVIVDEILDFEETVVKQLGIHLKHLNIYLGASLIGGGGVALLFDSHGLATQAGMAIESAKEEYEFADEESQDEICEYMLFRRNSQVLSVGLDCVLRLEKFKKSEIQRSGDLKVINYRKSVLPLIEPEKIVDFLEIKDNGPDEFYTIVLRVQDRYIGMVVDAIEDICQVKGPLDSDCVQDESISGSFFFENKIISVLSTEYLFKHSGIISNFDEEEVTPEEEFEVDNTDLSKIA